MAYIIVPGFSAATGVPNDVQPLVPYGPFPLAPPSAYPLLGENVKLVIDPAGQNGDTEITGGNFGYAF